MGDPIALGEIAAPISKRSDCCVEIVASRGIPSPLASPLPTTPTGVPIGRLTFLFRTKKGLCFTSACRIARSSAVEGHSRGRAQALLPVLRHAGDDDHDPDDLHRLRRHGRRMAPGGGARHLAHAEPHRALLRHRSTVHDLRPRGIFLRAHAHTGFFPLGSPGAGPRHHGAVHGPAVGCLQRVGACLLADGRALHRAASLGLRGVGLGLHGGSWGDRSQPAASRRTTAATSVSGSPTGQAAEAASRSASPPSRSDDASAIRA